MISAPTASQFFMALLNPIILLRTISGNLIMRLRGIALLLMLAGAICDSATAVDWRQFRGPNSNGVIEDAELPEVWGLDSNIRWKVPVPGEGWSAPIIVGQKVFVTTSVSAGRKDKESEHIWKVICLDAESGTTLWSKDAISSKPRLGTHRDNTYATETPATDGKKVVAYFGMMGAFC
jgi:outer membrane protein assembly factor BamB